MYQYIWRAEVFLNEGKSNTVERRFPVEAPSTGEADRIAALYSTNLSREVSQTIHGAILATDLLRQGRFLKHFVYGRRGLRLRSRTSLVVLGIILGMTITYITVVRPVSIEYSQIQSFLAERAEILHRAITPLKSKCPLEC